MNIRCEHFPEDAEIINYLSLTVYKTFAQNISLQLWSANYDLMSKAHLNQAHKLTIEIPKPALVTHMNNYYSIN